MMGEGWCTIIYRLFLLFSSFCTEGDSPWFFRFFIYSCRFEVFVGGFHDSFNKNIVCYLGGFGR